MAFKIGDHVDRLGIGGTITGGPLVLAWWDEESIFWTVKLDKPQPVFTLLGARPMSNRRYLLWEHDDLRLAPIPDPDRHLCPECEEEDFFLVDDYLCAACRWQTWDGP